MEKLLLLIYFVFLCAKTEKVVSLGKFDVLTELAVRTQPTAENLAVQQSQFKIKQ
jgi:hypothetical protein